MERKRLTAIKTDIKSVVDGKYFKAEGFESNYVITPVGVRISRVRIMATIMNKFVTEDGKYGFIVLDDGTETIRAKIFKSVKMLENLSIGDIVDVIGKIREYGDELYIAPEIIRKIEDPNFLILRKAELLDQRKKFEEIRKKIKEFQKKTSDLEEIKKLAQAEGISEEVVESIVESEEVDEEEIEDRKSMKDKVLEIIDMLDDGTGAEYSQVISESGLDENEVEEIINELLNDGICYEPRPGKIKRL
ncbi:MAG: hypothetical protein J7L45_03240 [Candidatus Aenigmarchaeota archaeon]|nr:hypothetical protein [Candidatus Aenigmarchaeota archaeon]